MKSVKSRRKKNGANRPKSGVKAVQSAPTRLNAQKDGRAVANRINFRQEESDATEFMRIIGMLQHVVTS